MESPLQSQSVALQIDKPRVTPELPTDAWVHILSYLCNLRELCRYARVSKRWQRLCNNVMLWRTVDLSLAPLSGMKRTILGLSMNLGMVETLRARSVVLSADVVQPLFRRLRAVRELDLSYTTCPNALPLIQANCHRLEVLSLAYCKSVNGSDLERLKGCPLLKRLYLDGISNIQDSAISFLANLPSLEHLSLRCCYSLTDLTVAVICESSSLRSLDVRGCAISAASLKEIPLSIDVYRDI